MYILHIYIQINIQLKKVYNRRYYKHMNIRSASGKSFRKSFATPSQSLRKAFATLLRNSFAQLLHTTPTPAHLKGGSAPQRQPRCDSAVLRSCEDVAKELRTTCWRTFWRLYVHIAYIYIYLYLVNFYKSLSLSLYIYT